MTIPAASSAPAAADRRRRVSRGALHLALVLAFGLIVCAPLLQPGYFWGAHDARHDVYFIFQYDKSVQDGIWLPRWSPDWTFGYGYPFFIVYGPLATFVGELFHHFLGLGFEDCVKAVLGLSVLASGLAMYGFVRSWLGRHAGLVAAVAYMAIPYHLVDVFVRAAMAESVALVFLPLALWGFRETILRPRPAAIIGAAAAYAAIMWTSNLVALIFTPGLLAFIAFLLWGELHSRYANQPPARWLARLRAVRALRTLVPPALAFLLGLGLSAAFFVPALVEQGYINQAQWFGHYYDPAQHFVYFHQLLNPAWGFGISQPGPDEATAGGMSYQLGLAALLFSLVTIVTAGRLSRVVRREMWFWAGWACIAVLLTLEISAPAWRHLPIVPYAQFPWRYLMLAMLPLSILPAMLIAPPAASGDAPPGPAAAERRAWPAFVIAVLLLLSSLSYLKVEIREPTPQQGPVSDAALMRFQRTSDEMTGVTAWVDADRRPHWSPMADQWIRNQAVTTRVDYSQVPQNQTLAVNSEEMGSAHEQVYYYAQDPGQAITFNRFWYPGWTAHLLDGKDGAAIRQLPVEREQGPLARIVVPVPAGEGYILLRFEDTPLRTAARWLTLLSLGASIVALLIHAAWQRRAHGRPQSNHHDGR